MQALVAQLDLDVWGRRRTTMEVRVTAAQLRSLKQQQPGVTVRVVDSNIQRRIDAETKQLNEQLAHPVKADWFTAYHRYGEIVEWMRGLAAQYPERVTFTSSIGKSIEKRDIAMLKVSGKAGGSGSKRSIIFEGLQHSREWISTATTQYIAHQLASQYGTNADYTRLLDSADFYIIPVVNPDGYEYSWTTARLWRKNRNGSGTDLNRNWPDHWGGSGSSGSPSSDTYRGVSPASEPEVQAVIQFAKTLNNVAGFIDFHSYSQLVLRPYSWTYDVSPDEATYKKVGDAMAAAIKGVAGTDYTSQTGADLYTAAGGADDYFYGNYTAGASARRAYGMTIELSPKDSWGGGGFVLPPDQIIPVGKDIMPAVVKFSDFVLANVLPAGRPW